MNNLLVEDIIDEVIKRVKKEAFIEVEASGKHVHLCEEHINILFGRDYHLNKVKDLSQPGQYACKERVTITGPKGSLKNVVVLGPARKSTQVEISLTDATVLGIKAPVKESGKIEGTPGITISTERATLTIDKGVIVAKRHIHITPEDAEKFGVKDKEIIQAKVYGNRPLIFDDVVIRVSPDFRTYMHIDYDEANACGFTKGTLCRIVK
ncbi:ethanolamine utilization phosphate acetyltransferase EutD [Clostridium sp. UBA871]|uniref:ethanolamine utilization phosphate acetyltransferase EutD n=1 Tax=Clostridium sp. UBA871 TaxID=1946380 RepID=UPI003217B27F